ncbi:MAG: hypothetical protein ACR652_24730 [Methylocystis sp.]|uniref:hypothetical protein n=1 Tax=Methylocystis sp. TaxID=1911079 RepID=UPI003DA52665
MSKGLTVRLNKLEGAKEAGKLVIVFARFPSELTEVEADRARLEAEGRRVLLIRWQGEQH